MNRYSKESSGKTLALVRVLFILGLLFSIILISIKGSFIFALLLIGGVAVVLAGMVRRHARRTVYHCQLCDGRFLVTRWIDFVSPHTMHSKLLRCPSCGKVSWCQAIALNKLPIPRGR